MNKYLMIGVCAALTALSPSAIAFDEQQGRVGGKPAAGLSSGEAQVSKDQGGTEVRIPGLGKLGVLPKMDFGLELLYGANEEAVQQSEPFAAQEPDGDLKVRGTVKHRF